MANVSGETPARPQLSPDGRWSWDGVRWVPVTRNAANRIAAIPVIVLAMRLIFVLPVALGLFMAVVSPSYFRPMLSAPLGIAMLAAGVIVVAAGLALTEVMGRLMRRGRGRLLAGMALMCGLVLLEFIPMWIVLLGPAVLILTNPGSG